jgi:hypothetical protein
MLPTKARFGGSQHEENERLSRRNFWLILAVTAIMLTAFPFLVRPFSQQSNDNSPSPQPFIFFILVDEKVRNFLKAKGVIIEYLEYNRILGIYRTLR